MNQRIVADLRAVDALGVVRVCVRQIQGRAVLLLADGNDARGELLVAGGEGDAGQVLSVFERNAAVQTGIVQKI